MNEKEKAFDEVFSKLTLLEDLFNNDFITLSEYWKIKNRIMEMQSLNLLKEKQFIRKEAL